MYQFNITIYFMILGIAVYYHNPIYISCWLLLGIFIIMLFPFYKKIRKQKIANKLVKVNVNRASWWEIEELPGFNRVNAKKVIWIRKHNGKYLSKEDFYKKNSVKNIEELEKLIVI